MTQNIEIRKIPSLEFIRAIDPTILWDNYKGIFIVVPQSRWEHAKEIREIAKKHRLSAKWNTKYRGYLVQHLAPGEEE